jgi:addiction module HigA family antidote
MAMFNPTLPGEFISETYPQPNDMSVRSLTESLAVASSTLNRFIYGQSGISPEMALRLSIAIGTTPESWLAMQHHYGLCTAKQTTDLSNVERVKYNAA